ncbi:ATPase-3 [Coleophoma crateriformis]|uniref:ATPase-3 n=1 Tax=Coleophoma crateriformis TaxID=565419 RepID=A0A3D8QR08_9HELO|nr:ATPase-3 [Coleophoma crateriformis]
MYLDNGQPAGELRPRLKMWKSLTPQLPFVTKARDHYSSNPSSTPSKELLEAAALVPGKDADFGTFAAVKTFYEGDNSRPNAYNWVDTPPKQLNKKVAKANDRVAIKIFKIKDESQATIAGRTPLKIHAIELQSLVLVMALKDILIAENHWLEVTEPAKFQEPFKPLFFCYDKIVALKEETDGETVLGQHLQLLCQVMGEMFGGLMLQLKNLRASGLVSYKLAWAYFPRDSTIFSANDAATRVCRVLSTEYVTSLHPHLAVYCKEICFDGEAFSWKPFMLPISEFGGNVPVNSLSNYPLSFHPDPESVVERVKSRGKRVVEYQGLVHCEYSGLGILDRGKCIEKHNVSSRILIDNVGYHKHYEGVARKEAPIPQIPLPGLVRDFRIETNEGPAEQNTYLQPISEEQQQKNKEELLAREQDLLFVSPMLKGFSLKNKLWLNFFVDDITPVVWNDEAYGHLVYPEEQKDLVLTFVETHQRLGTSVDDVIMGKGQGLIVLLSGPPGTGKTLTAEAVADKTRRPLYYLQAEDLGTNAAYLGPKIKKVFEMATEWNAVILLDEADVFMAERSPADIARNELVSIFLRELEYFRGIIFLTTNLYATIDAAFRSRVNIHLVFHPLSVSSRLVVWQKFLSRLPAATTALSDADLHQLARWDLNGREIKNTVKTVRTWCTCKGFEMTLARVESGIKVTAPEATKEEV